MLPPPCAMEAHPDRDDISAIAWRNQQNDVCHQRRFRPAWMDAQHDPSLRRAHSFQREHSDD